MSEMPKEKSETELEDAEVEKEDSWEEDQKKNDYYYDDSHGYETYVPEDDEEDRAVFDEKKRLRLIKLP